MEYLRFPKYIQTLEQSLVQDSVDVYNVLVVKNFTLEKVFDSYLNYFLHFSNMHLNVEYASWEDIANVTDFSKYEYILVWLNIDNIYKNFKITDQEKIERILGLIEEINKLSIKSNRDLLVVEFEPLCFSSVSNIDVWDKNSIYNQLKNIEICDNNEKIHKIPVHQLFIRYGYENILNPTYSKGWDMPYSKIGFREYANLIASFIVGHKNKAKKCLVLDCDNVLWGGIAEEDGVQNVTLSNIGKGLYYKDFQKSVLDLYSRGIILAICSKNNELTLKHIFNEHPDMLLTLEHFSVVKSNWNNKADNLREIARELNISLNSCVFIDDSEFEINWVSHELPEVTCIRFDTDSIENMVKLLRTNSLFTGLYLTKEDLNRNEIYRAKHAEKKLSESSKSYDEFLKKLSIKVELREATKFDAERISQLMQRTNQFNVNRIRYTKYDIENFISKQHYATYVVTYCDKFFDYGIVGTLVLEKVKGCFNIKVFNLSCKVLNRYVEDKMMQFCFEKSKQENFTHIKITHIPCNENLLATEYIKNQKFSKLNENIYVHEI